MNQADSKNTVLIVDDSPANIQVVNSILKDIYKIRIATNGAKALELAKATPPPDLILLDVMMPEMDGYEVCTRLKADLETREIPVIFLTGQTEVEDETKGFEVGAVDYIHKPFSPAVVKARVQTHLVLRGITQPVSSRPTGGWPETGMWEITPEKHPDWHHHLDVKRPSRAVEELHQVAATRTERRLFVQVKLTPTRLRARVEGSLSGCMTFRSTVTRANRIKLTGASHQDWLGLTLFAPTICLAVISLQGLVAGSITTSRTPPWLG